MATNFRLTNQLIKSQGFLNQWDILIRHLEEELKKSQQSALKQSSKIENLKCEVKRLRTAQFSDELIKFDEGITTKELQMF